MREIMKEYGTAVVAALGAVLLLGIVGFMLFSGQGIMSRMIAAWGNGGC